MPVSLWCVLNTGWARNSLLRRSSCGISGSMPFSNSATFGSSWPSWAKIVHSSSISARVVVSSSEMQVYSPHACRTLAPIEIARAAMAGVCSPVLYESVSKADAWCICAVV
jgi:hypothetical protein